MKKICVVFLLFLFAFQLFADDDDDDKQKLAVMEFEDLSGNLSAGMLSGATEYIRGAFVSSNKFIVIAKERQEKAMIKEMKKESYKACNDKNCQIPLGQALSADTILRTTINFFGGVYTITSELIDLAKEATVVGAKQKFNGSEQSLMEALDRIVIQITGTGVSYDISAMQTQEIKGVKLGGVELSNMPKIEMQEADFDAVSSNLAVSELESNSGVSLDADADVLVQYDKCVETDKKSQNSPIIAINCWKKLASMEENNPFIDQAEKRVAEWEKFIKSKKLADLFEKAKKADKQGQIFPKEALAAWREIGKEKNNNPYYQTALERYNFWKQYKSQVDKYTAQLKDFEKQRKQDIEKLKKVLPLKVINDAQKRTVLVQYMEIYSPFYGIEDVDNIITSLSDKAISRHLYGLLHNEYLKKEMDQKCDSGNGAACYISASLTKSDEPDKSLKFLEKSCDKGVVEACVETGKIYLNKNRKKEAAKLFYDACGMKSPEGCQLAGYVTQRGEGVEKDLPLSKEIYQLVNDMGYEASSINGCYFGYEEACKGGKLVSKKAESPQKSKKTNNTKEQNSKIRKENPKTEKRNETLKTNLTDLYHNYDSPADEKLEGIFSGRWNLGIGSSFLPSFALSTGFDFNFRVFTKPQGYGAGKLFVGIGTDFIFSYRTRTLRGVKILKYDFLFPILANLVYEFKINNKTLRYIGLLFSTGYVADIYFRQRPDFPDKTIVEPGFFGWEIGTHLIFSNKLTLGLDLGGLNYMPYILLINVGTIF